jgi:predicted DNA-binding ribbon-helix-helix protein
MNVMFNRPTADEQAPTCRNVLVSGRRTSVRMEAVMWRSLEDIRQREGLTINQICTLVDNLRGEAGLTAALRVFIVGYYREVARDLMMQSGSSAAAPVRRDPFGRSKPLAAAVRTFGSNGAGMAF